MHKLIASLFGVWLATMILIACDSPTPPTTSPRAALPQQTDPSQTSTGAAAEEAAGQIVEIPKPRLALFPAPVFHRVEPGGIDPGLRNRTGDRGHAGDMNPVAERQVAAHGDGFNIGITRNYAAWCIPRMGQMLGIPNYPHALPMGD